jgi:hypothetical protein
MRLRLSLSSNLKPCSSLKPSPRFNLGLSLHGIRRRHRRMCLMGLWWVVNRSDVLQSNAGAIGGFEVHASISGQELPSAASYIQAPVPGRH